MLQERRAIPTEYSVQIAYYDVKEQLPAEGYDREKVLDILRQAIEDYKEDPRNLDAISRIYTIVHEIVRDTTSYYYLYDTLWDQVNEILRTNFSPDILTEPLIVWKKARRARWVNVGVLTVKFGFNESETYSDAVLVKLELPVGARVLRSLFSNKCRTDKAKVLEITSLDGSVNYQTAHSYRDWDYYYNVGEVVEPHLGKLDDRAWVSCSFGIHFFETKKEALEYDFR